MSAAFGSATRAQRLQRVVVRMLHDPELRRRIYAEPAQMAVELELSPGEVAALTRPDPRAWSVDVHRSDRVLTALLGEFAVSALALMAGGVTLPDLAGYFSDPAFHLAVMERRSLFLSFPAYLDGLAERALKGTPRRVGRAIVALEAAIARVRRATSSPERAATAPTAGPETRWSLAPTVAPVELAAGTLPLWERAHADLKRGGDPVEALLARARPRLPEPKGDGTEWVLVTLGADGPEIGLTGEALGRLLLGATGVPRAVLVGLACAEGASEGEAEEILDELAAEGLIVRG